MASGQHAAVSAEHSRRDAGPKCEGRRGRGALKKIECIVKEEKRDKESNGKEDEDVRRRSAAAEDKAMKNKCCKELQRALKRPRDAKARAAVSDALQKWQGLKEIPQISEGSSDNKYHT